MREPFLDEHSGQISFFDRVNITADTKLIDNTDGIYRGNIFEFKLTIPDLNKVLFQAIKYLSYMRIKGESIPRNILLISLNEEMAYLFNSEDYLADIEKVYSGAASKNLNGFAAHTSPESIKYSEISGLQRLTEVLQSDNFVRIHIDVFDVVGWANRFYREQPSATKIEMFEELRNPSYFEDFLYPWDGDEKDFRYIMDLLNDVQHKKELGAFYTPPLYCRRATTYVRTAISRIKCNHPDNDYIILDRCAGTGNLEEFLTDKNVDDIALSELKHFLEPDFEAKYISSLEFGIKFLVSNGKRNIGDITLGELFPYEGEIKIRDYLFDDELSHVVVNTYELKEWIVLNERLGDKVRLIIPPSDEVNNAEPLVSGGDALSEEFVLGNGVMTVAYQQGIDLLKSYVRSDKTNIILLENPPYRDTSAGNTDHSGNKTNKGCYVYEKMKNELESLANSNISTARDISNQFIWSGWKYYLRKPDDYFVLFSPIKYWKSLGLGERTFVDGCFFNREYFHASKSAISCILWQNIPDSIDSLNLKAFDIVEDDDEFYKNIYMKEITQINVKKVFNTLSAYYDRRIFDDDTKDGVKVKSDGCESASTGGTFNKNMVGFLSTNSFSVDPIRCILVRCEHRDGRGMILRSDNFVNYLPLFCAKCYPQKKWYEKDVYFTTSDGGNEYLEDKDFLKACLIFSCLTIKNHCKSFFGSDGRLYENELCFDDKSIAREKIDEYALTDDERNLIDIFDTIMNFAKKTNNYNNKYKYGLYQVDKEINTYHQIGDGKNMMKQYDHPELNTKINQLRELLSKYYEKQIQPKLFEYELLK